MKQKQQAAEDEEEDPLDAFMAGIQDQVRSKAKVYFLNFTEE